MKRTMLALAIGGSPSLAGCGPNTTGPGPTRGALRAAGGAGAAAPCRAPLAAALAGAGALVGCGYDPGERAVTGGALGAAGGAAIGALTGAPLTGALIGGAAGAAGGALTSPYDVNLGRPYYYDPYY